MARPKKPIAGMGATETVGTAAAAAALAAPQAPEPTGVAGGVAAPSAAPVDAPPQENQTASADPEPVRPTHGPAGFALKITGPAMGRWRAGRKFGPEPVTIPAPELTEAECEALLADPELVCELIQPDA